MLLINKVYSISINNIDDKLTWQFTSNGDFFIKTTTWADNISVKPHPKTKFLTSLWKLNFRPKLHLFAWKLIPDILLTKGKLRHIGIDINGVCQFCYKTEKNIDHIFNSCGLAFKVWIA